MEERNTSGSSIVISEGNGHISRENKSHSFSEGQIIHEKANGTLEEYTGANGQTARYVAILKGVVIARLAELNENRLIGMDDAAKTALATHQIIIR